MKTRMLKIRRVGVVFFAVLMITGILPTTTALADASYTLTVDYSILSTSDPAISTSDIDAAAANEGVSSSEYLAGLRTLKITGVIPGGGNRAFDNNKYKMLNRWVSSGKPGQNVTTLDYTGITNMLSIGASSFAPASVTTILLPKNGALTTINPSAFLGFQTVEIISVPDSVTSIGANAFQNCSRLKAMNLARISMINEYTFASCSNLEILTYANRLPAVMNSTAFSGGSSLVVVPPINDYINDYDLEDYPWNAHTLELVTGYLVMEGDELRINIPHFTNASNVQWYKQPDGGAREAIPGATNSVYTKTMTEEDAGFYSCSFTVFGVSLHINAGSFAFAPNPTEEPTPIFAPWSPQIPVYGYIGEDATYNDPDPNDPDVPPEYSPTGTMINVSVPVKILWAAFASQGGSVESPTYKVKNNMSNIALDVTLVSFLPKVSASNTAIDSRLTLNLTGSEMAYSNVLGYSGGTTPYGTVLAKSGQWSFGISGEYTGGFATPHTPSYDMVLRFSLH